MADDTSADGPGPEQDDSFDGVRGGSMVIRQHAIARDLSFYRPMAPQITSEHRFLLWLLGQTQRCWTNGK